jgi:hypothetical protein
LRRGGCPQRWKWSVNREHGAPIGGPAPAGLCGRGRKCVKGTNARCALPRDGRNQMLLLRLLTDTTTATQCL